MILFEWFKKLKTFKFFGNYTELYLIRKCKWSNYIFCIYVKVVFLNSPHIFWLNYHFTVFFSYCFLYSIHFKIVVFEIFWARNFVIKFKHSLTADFLATHELFKNKPIIWWLTQLNEWFCSVGYSWSNNISLFDTLLDNTHYITCMLEPITKNAFYSESHYLCIVCTLNAYFCTRLRTICLKKSCFVVHFKFKHHIYELCPCNFTCLVVWNRKFVCIDVYCWVSNSYNSGEILDYWCDCWMLASSNIKSKQLRYSLWATCSSPNQEEIVLSLYTLIKWNNYRALNTYKAWWGCWDRVIINCLNAYYLAGWYRINKVWCNICCWGAYICWLNRFVTLRKFSL